MDKHIANSLIANSGLHFKTCEVAFNPEEPLLLPLIPQHYYKIFFLST